SLSPSSVAAGGVAVHALSTGTTTVSASIAGFLAVTLASQLVTVTTPAVTMPSPLTVGAGLQTALQTATLGAAQHGGVSVHIASSNPSVALVAPNTTTAGAASIDVAVANGVTSLSFVVQGVETAPTPATVVITASAAGFTNGTTAVTVVQP